MKPPPSGGCNSQYVLKIPRNFKPRDVYRCTGTDSARFGGTRLCSSKQVGTHAIEIIVWEEVKKLLNNPKMIYDEYQRRLSETDKSPADDVYTALEKQRVKLEKGISLLIDSYTQQYINQDEFEPRIKAMRQRLKVIEEQQNKLEKEKNMAREIELVITNLEKFSGGISSNIEQLDWSGKRDMIRRVVKRIEIGDEEISIVYKINKPSMHENWSFDKRVRTPILLSNVYKNANKGLC